LFAQKAAAVSNEDDEGLEGFFGKLAIFQAVARVKVCSSTSSRNSPNSYNSLFFNNMSFRCKVGRRTEEIFQPNRKTCRVRLVIFASEAKESTRTVQKLNMNAVYFSTAVGGLQESCNNDHRFKQPNAMKENKLGELLYRTIRVLIPNSRRSAMRSRTRDSGNGPPMKRDWHAWVRQRILSERS
jgi:hypothetical protein